MNEITLQQTKAALENLQYEDNVPDDIRIKAKKAIDRMLTI
jgi:quinolinate synthase